jgi:ATP:corrinoid adenosyltransferase
MTPKEKAEYLTDIFTDCDDYTESVGINHALKCVNEILEATKTAIDRPEYSGIVYDSFWAKVKYELITMQNA